MKPPMADRLVLTAWLILALVCSVLVSKEVLAADPRFCGVVYRDAVTKEIIRNHNLKKQFEELVPCIAPCDSTWEVDHIYPLSTGGCDSIINVQWMSPAIKRCRVSNGHIGKDCFERKLYGQQPFITVYK